MELQIPDSWLALPEVLGKGPRSIVVIGATDSGKSTLCRWLASQFAEAGALCALIDADLGQSQIGPPTCVGVGVATKKGIEERAAFFAGDVSPGRIVPQMLAAFAEAARAAHGLGGAFIIVDTTGWISGHEAVAVKMAKSKILGEAHVILIEREDELRPFRRGWRNIERFPLHVLPVLPAVTRRSRDTRRTYREAAFREYFKGAVECEFDLRAAAVSGPLNLRLPRPSVPRGLLVGLNDGEGKLLSLGTVRELDATEGMLTVLCRAEGAQAAEVQFGRLVVNRDGSHVSFSEY